MAQFLGNLPVGAKVKFGNYSVSGSSAQPITWVIAAKNHSNYPTNSVTLITEKLIDELSYDASEPLSSVFDSTVGGNSEYMYSNIDQWLNKDAPGGNWYVATHSADQSPDNSHVRNNRGYADRPAFLNGFSTDEKNIILNTTIPCTSGYGVSHSIERKVFLASAGELGLSNTKYSEGSLFEYFTSASIVCGRTDQLYNDPTLTNKNSAPSWWTRTPYNMYQTYVVSEYGGAGYTSANTPYGVRPVLNLPTSAKISDGTDSSGYYTFEWNAAPMSPSGIYVPSSVYGGKPNTISWDRAYDPDGDAVTYQLECSIDGGEYSLIYIGTSTAYSHLIPFGVSTVSYRVRAFDPSGESSAYTTSATINVVNNYAPVISGADTNLGVKSDDFTGTYTITDANSDTVTVTEAIDGVQIRALVVTLGQTITYGVTGNTWLALPNGSHTLTISATDGIDTSVRTIVFTKLVDKLIIQNKNPWIATKMPSRIMLVVTRNIPSGAIFKVEVCNNAYDDTPIWENATDAVRSGLVHVFSNDKKITENWGVQVRVTVERNGTTGACYVSAIGGNFE